MSGAPIVVPFDYEPESVSVKTGAYSIPAGKYAKVTAQVFKNGSFTIDSNVALEALPGLALNVLVNNLSPYTVPQGYIAHFTFLPTSGGGQVLQINGVNLVTPPFGSSADPKDFMTMPAGAVLSSTGGGGNDIELTGGLEPLARDIVGEFWVTEGTNISISGDGQYTVSLYNQKT